MYKFKLSKLTKARMFNMGNNASLSVGNLESSVKI